MGDDKEKTPGRQAIETMQKDIAVFKTPIGIPKKRPKKVLSEEDYIEEIGKIIERDFFPDLEKLKAQNQYLDAVERNDVSKLRELYAKYSGRKPTERLPSPATFETPANIHNSQHTTPIAENKSTEDTTEDKMKKFKKLSLDQYLNSHTSQDNQSFEEILGEMELKHKQKYSYLYKDESKCEEEQRKQLALPPIEDQFGKLPEKKLNLDTWGFKNRNHIMFVPNGADLSREELAEKERKRLEIAHDNTRLVGNPFNESQSKETINELAKTQAKVLDGKIGVDGKEILKADTPRIGGFSLVRTPSPCPAAMASPLMTWGEIEGTPFRLDGSDTPLSRTQGPSFKMAEPPRREQLALALAEQVGEKNRDRKKKAMDAARRHLASPSPRTNSLERLATMSPAARRLATSSLKIGAISLSSPYSPSQVWSPQRSGVRTPKTPKRAVTPKLNLGIKRVEAGDNLTDDLLKIKVPTRQTAADFF